MYYAFEIAKTISIGSFLAYGLACLFSTHMVAEFERFGLSGFRRLTGAFEVAGALGLLVGTLFPSVLVAASAGLSLLMAIGVGVRFYAGDSFPQSLPALLFLGLNTFILNEALKAMM